MIDSDVRRARAAALRALPDGAEVWRGSAGYTKRRGEWCSFGSPGGDRFTSNELAVLGYSVADVKTAHDRGFAHGYAEAVERARLDEATAEDGPTWFAVPAGAVPDADIDDYERGYLAGWSEYFEATV